MSTAATAPEVRPVVEIACDESGFVGGSLFGGARVFTHASVRVGLDEAEALVAEVRRRTGAHGHELKASQLNRPWGRRVAGWLCGPDGPLAGRTVVHVTDTRLFGLGRLAQVVTLEVPPQGWWGADADAEAWALAQRLYDALAAAPDQAAEAFLAGARDLLWLNRRAQPRTVPSTWPEVAGRVAGADTMADPQADPLADPLAEPLDDQVAGPVALRRLERYLAAPPDAPLTEPLLPALAWTIEHWSEHGDPAVVHDEQSVLTPGRVAAIGEALTVTHPERKLAGFARVDSRDDPRVQVADLVAGVVRRVVEEHLEGKQATDVRVTHLVADGSLLA